MHHIVSDGWSMGVLIRELARAVRRVPRGRGRSPLPELPVQYADYAVWQREQLAGEVLERQLAYWRERLAGAPGAAGAAHRPARARRCRRTAARTVAVELPARAAGRGCRRWRGSEGATLFMTLLAAFQVLLSRYSGQDDVVVGTPDRRAHARGRWRG